MKISGRFVQTLQKLQLGYPVNTGRKLNVHKTFSTSSERLTYVQFMSYVYGLTVMRFLPISVIFLLLSLSMRDEIS